MAQTRGGYEEIDDGDIDAGSIVTEGTMSRMRDQWFAALCDPATVAPATDRISLPGRAKTAEIDASKVLQPDGSGGVRWSAGSIPVIIDSGSWTGASNSYTITTSLAGGVGSAYRLVVMLTGWSSLTPMQVLDAMIYRHLNDSGASTWSDFITHSISTNTISIVASASSIQINCTDIESTHTYSWWVQEVIAS